MSTPMLLSPGCADPFYRKAIRTSSGSALMVPFASAEPWPDALDTVRSRRFRDRGDHAGTRAAGGYRGLRGHSAARGRVAVVFGSEGQGLTPAALARADIRVRIAMSGGPIH